MEKTTETRNKETEDINTKSTKEIVDIINKEDCTVALSVEKQIENIAKAADIIIDSFNNKGRLFFIGAGTSGRLGIVQAAECPPTFGTDPEMIQGIIAGGKDSVFKAKEGSEDSEDNGFETIKEKFSSKDVLVGISASGTTPFVIGGLKAAKEIGCKTISLSCNKDTKISKFADISIEVVVGPEVITGSTRMKAGTAQKMVLDMLTTTALIKTGKVTGNLMTHLRAGSEKLKERAKRIVVELTELKNLSKEEAYKKAEELLEKNDYNINKAVDSINNL